MTVETTAQLRQKRGYLLWLTGGALGVSLIWAGLLGRRGQAVPARPDAEVTRPDELNDQIRRLEGKVLKLQGSVHAVRAMQAAEGERLSSLGSNRTSSQANQAAEEAPELTEERLREQTAERIDKRYAFLEQRLSAEPVDSNGSRAAEQALRQRVETLEGHELLKVECRYTMCRLEVKSDAPSAAAVMRRLGFTEGGEIRRRDDGSFLIFAGRDGFPFQGLNGPE